MPAILRHDSPTNHARSEAHLCSQSPGEQASGTFQQSFCSQGQSWHAKPRCTPQTTQYPGPTFPVPRTAGIFTCSCKSPHGLQLTKHTDPFRGLAAQGTPGACFLKHTSLCGQCNRAAVMLYDSKAKQFGKVLNKYRAGAAFINPSEMSTWDGESADFLMLHCH